MKKCLLHKMMLTAVMAMSFNAVLHAQQTQTPPAVVTVNGVANVGNAAMNCDEYFDLTGKPLPQPQRGVNIVRKADGTTRKIIMK